MTQRVRHLVPKDDNSPHIMFACNPLVKNWDEYPGYAHVAAPTPDPAISELDPDDATKLDDVHLFLMKNYATERESKYRWKHPKNKKTYVFTRKKAPVAITYEQAVTKLLTPACINKVTTQEGYVVPEKHAALLADAEKVRHVLELDLTRYHTLIDLTVVELQEVLNRRRNFLRDIMREVKLQKAALKTTYESHDPEAGRECSEKMKEFDKLNKEEKAERILQAAEITSDVARELNAQRENPNTPLSEDEKASLERAHVLATYGDLPAFASSQLTDTADDEMDVDSTDDDPDGGPDLIELARAFDRKVMVTFRELCALDDPSFDDCRAAILWRFEKEKSNEPFKFIEDGQHKPATQLALQNLLHAFGFDSPVRDINKEGTVDRAELRKAVASMDKEKNGGIPQRKNDDIVLKAAQRYLKENWYVEPVATESEGKRVRAERERLRRAAETDNQPATTTPPRVSVFKLDDKSPWQVLGVRPSWALYERYRAFQQQERPGTLRFDFIGFDIVSEVLEAG